MRNRCLEGNKAARKCTRIFFFVSWYSSGERKNKMALAELFPIGAGRDHGRDAAWFALLLVAALGSSVTFECVTPFAAFAVLIAATMPWRRALGTMVAIWLINQLIGYAALGYPVDGLSLAWGGAIGAASLAAIAAAVPIARSGGAPWLRIALGFAAALAVYEGVLFLVSLGLGGSENFSPAIVAQVALSDAGWLLGLGILRHLLLRLAGMRREWRHAVTT
jgi:hypothetical protein